ncbi:hypothetical protein CTAYLR_003471 [Chrysophaeum taylorii]|nr:hypothetical protein CTAYLR_003471 [Chrysophaeum taylorii]
MVAASWRELDAAVAAKRAVATAVSAMAATARSLAARAAATTKSGIVVGEMANGSRGWSSVIFILRAAFPPRLSHRSCGVRAQLHLPTTTSFLKRTRKSTVSPSVEKRWRHKGLDDEASLEEVHGLCVYVRSLLIEEANVVVVESPVTICGDIHGQFQDLLELFKIAGSPADTNYVFLGDYVDRGRDSVEVLELLLCYKAKFPKRVTLLRGNHECRQITQIYGFYDECVAKYGSPTVWRDCCSVFDVLNVSAVVEGSVFCVHGGLSPLARTMDQVATIDRAVELPTEGALCDLLWSDPSEDAEDFVVSNRGAGYLFGPRAAATFCRVNRIDWIARAHQLVMDGYKHHFDDKSVVTVWSAPNYCGRCGNLASVLRLDSHLFQHFLTFRQAPSKAVPVDDDKNTTPQFDDDDDDDRRAAIFL